MKLRNLFFIALSVVFFSSCSGGANSEMCDCAGKTLEMAKEMKKAQADNAEDPTKMMEASKTIQEKYKADLDKCAETAKKMGEGKTPEELKKMGEEFKESCPAVKEAEELMKK